MPHCVNVKNLLDFNIFLRYKCAKDKNFVKKEHRKMNLLGIIKDIDGVGRVVIPKALRDRYGLSKQIEVIAVEEGVLIRKPKSEICEKE